MLHVLSFESILAGFETIKLVLKQLSWFWIILAYFETILSVLSHFSKLPILIQLTCFDSNSFDLIQIICFQCNYNVLIQLTCLDEGTGWGNWMTKNVIILFVIGMQVNLLLCKWMRELEKVFYINIDAFYRGMLPEAKQDDVQIKKQDKFWSS